MSTLSGQKTTSKSKYYTITTPTLNAEAKCDTKKPTCSSCLRAAAPCSGYRDASLIRFTDQTSSIVTKQTIRAKPLKTSTPSVPFRIHHIHQDLQTLGREMFFGTYVSDFSSTWDFLFPYLDSASTPDHLAAGIDAVSLAFLAHQVSSPTAKEMGRVKYADALRRINKAIQDPEKVGAMSTFQSALLLDLFEKITVADSEGHVRRHAHVEGAFALITVRGVQNFRPGPELKALLGFSLNATICALSNGETIPNEVRLIREHARQFVDTEYPKWKLNECILEVTELPDETRNRSLTAQERMSRSAVLDARLEQVALEAAPSWSYERKFVSGYDQRVSLPEGICMYDVYANRMMTQGFNVLRLVRILLCEEIIGLSGDLDDPKSEVAYERARAVIVEMAREICASAPQMTNCDFAARHKLPSGTAPGMAHTHTQSHILDVYVMIFSLYMVAWSRNCPIDYSIWAVGQLQHIAEHFVIREAAIVLGMLRAPDGKDRKEAWYVSSFRCCSSFVEERFANTASGRGDHGVCTNYWEVMHLLQASSPCRKQRK